MIGATPNPNGRRASVGGGILPNLERSLRGGRAAHAVARVHGVIA